VLVDFKSIFGLVCDLDEGEKSESKYI